MFALYGMGDCEPGEANDLAAQIGILPIDQRNDFLATLASNDCATAQAMIMRQREASRQAAIAANESVKNNGEVSQAFYDELARGATPSITTPMPGATATVVKSQTDIAAIINAIGNGVSGGLSARQNAMLQAQLLAAQRNQQPVYIPSATNWGTIALAVGAAAVLIGGFVLLRRRA